MRFWRGLQLRTRLYIILGLLLLIVTTIGISQLYYTFYIQSTTAALYNDNIRTVLIVQELKDAITSQKGFVSYFVLDNNPEWLELLAENRIRSDSILQRLALIDRNTETASLLNRIRIKYSTYDSIRAFVIAEYRAGNFERGKEIHTDARFQLLTILSLVDTYTQFHDRILIKRIAALQRQTYKIRLATTVAVIVAVLLSLALVILLRIDIFKPIHSMTSRLARGEHQNQSANEVAELGHQIHGLLEDVGKGHQELQKSRSRLVESEKMAVVGKLAAELAHGIRSPMTSIEMRLFSLEKTLSFDENQRGNLQAIHDDLQHLDAVIANFLEFSRPPRLVKSRIDIEQPINRALLLLEHKLRRHTIEVSVVPPTHQLHCFGDSERLKEVFVNLLVNSCDAIGESGQVQIEIISRQSQDNGTNIEIRLTDTGPGIPEDVLKKLWEPFVTTKENGTGLGLSIAKRIIQEHGGSINANTTQPSGAQFIIAVPQCE